MKKEEYLIDDRVIIPEDIKKMSADELDKEIAHLEAELKRRRKQSDSFDKAV